MKNVLLIVFIPGVSIRKELLPDFLPDFGERDKSIAQINMDGISYTTEAAPDMPDILIIDDRRIENNVRSYFTGIPAIIHTIYAAFHADSEFKSAQFQCLQQDVGKKKLISIDYHRNDNDRFFRLFLRVIKYIAKNEEYNEALKTLIDYIRTIKRMENKLDILHKLLLPSPRLDHIEENFASLVLSENYKAGWVNFKEQCQPNRFRNAFDKEYIGESKGLAQLRDLLLNDDA